MAGNGKKAGGAKKGTRSLENVAEYRHKEAKRKNNPPPKIAAEGVVPVMPKIKYGYSPRLAPVLRPDHDGSPSASQSSAGGLPSVLATSNSQTARSRAPLTFPSIPPGRLAQFSYDARRAMEGTVARNKLLN